MKPTVISNASASASAGNGTPSGTSSNGITIPINHEYGAQHHQQPHPHYHQAQQQAYSPQQQQQQHPNASQGFSTGSPSNNTRQYPANFQQGGFGFDHDMDDMFPRSRLGRLHDPFAGFATTRKRCGNDPQAAASDGFSHYFDDDPDFGFPQFGSLGRRRAGANATSIDPITGLPLHRGSDLFNRLPSEFRQYIPEGFGTQRRNTAQTAQHPQQHQQPQYYEQPQQQQHYAQPTNTTPNHNGSGIPQSPSKKLCDAAIQTEDPSAGVERSEVDGHHMQPPMQQQDHLNHHGLRNTVDMGVKSVPENSQEHGPRSHSAPPHEQLQQQQQQQHQPSASSQYSTQTSPQVGNTAQQQPPHYQKVYYPPQQQQQKQRSPPPTPQTPGGTYIRTIPIFVEGRSEPIINSHKEIPNQNGTGVSASATATASARQVPTQQQQHPQQQQQYYPSHSQQHHQQPQHHPPQHRPTPLNTQQQPQQQQQQPGAASSSGLPPQTPHTMDSINKIQDIQRDVLDLMSKVENFAGTRKDKEYAYLDEMLTRNLLKLDTIDTNGKESIRLARKEAIKCIQASINVLEAKAEENARAAEQSSGATTESQQGHNDGEVSATKETAATETPAPVAEEQPVDATQMQEPIPLPPPEGMQIDQSSTTNDAETSKASSPPKDLQTAESTESKME